MQDTYRQCASVVLLRSSVGCSPDGCGNLYQVLLVHKPRQKDAWQLPQGGVEEGETVEEAALRELQEEAGVTAKIIGESRQTYRYDFPASYRRFRPDHICGQLIRFVFAVPDGAQAVQVDGKEIDSFVWVDPEQLRQYLRRSKYLHLVQSLVQQAIAVLNDGSVDK
jgi:8-oxo-dGTP pyrophosphatase MutT (NUDIX family)